MPSRFLASPMSLSFSSVFRGSDYATAKEIISTLPKLKSGEKKKRKHFFLSIKYVQGTEMKVELFKIKKNGKKEKICA